MLRRSWLRSATLRAGLLLLAVCALGAGASAQISPGPLAKAHQSLNGDTNCIKCHEVSTRAPSFKCLECHREIAAEIQQNKGLHATFPRSGPPGSACVKCHSDHNGVDFNMIHWNPTPSGFDHAKTGYVLDGKHVGVSCRACHLAQHIAPAQRALLPGKDLESHMDGLVACVRDLPRRQAPGPLRGELRAMSQHDGLEGCQPQSRDVRSLEDTLSAHGRASLCAVLELSHGGRRRSDPLCRTALRQLLGLPSRSAQGRVQAGMRFLPHDVHVEEVELYNDVRSLEDELSVGRQAS